MDHSLISEKIPVVVSLIVLLILVGLLLTMTKVPDLLVVLLTLRCHSFPLLSLFRLVKVPVVVLSMNRSLRMLAVVIFDHRAVPQVKQRTATIGSVVNR